MSIIRCVCNRRHRLAEAERKARRQLDAALDDVHEQRIASGARQSDLAAVLGCSRPWIGRLEHGKVNDVGIIELARLSAAVGLDLAVRVYPGVSVLRDAGQLKLLGRFREDCSSQLPWRLEVSVAPGDQRTFDAMLGYLPRAAAVEAITRLRDVQAQVRAAQAKQEVARVPVLILLISGTAANRRALREAGGALLGAFPIGTRGAMSALRRGELPSANAIVVL